jgi:proton-coupled amino acid transporter
VKAMVGLDIAPQYWLLVMVLIQIPLSWIRDISHLTITNSIVNALILYGLITCLGFTLQEATQGDSSKALMNI